MPDSSQLHGVTSNAYNTLIHVEVFIAVGHRNLYIRISQLGIMLKLIGTNNREFMCFEGRDDIEVMVRKEGAITYNTGLLPQDAIKAGEELIRLGRAMLEKQN